MDSIQSPTFPYESSPPDLTATANESVLEAPFIALIDFLSDVWDTSYSATRNLRLLIASVSKYLATQDLSSSTCLVYAKGAK